MEMISNKTPVISLIGRPNVGKSSIYNRLMKRANKVITHDIPGVTRDRHYGIATFDDMAGIDPLEAIIVDTGGFYPQKITEDDSNRDSFFNIMADHAKLAIAESDLVLFIVDAREGVIPFDKTIANFIRSEKKDFWLLVNKYDSDKQAGEEAEFYSLGVDSDDLITISAAHGRGFPTLRERIHKRIHALDTLNLGEDNELELQRGVKPNSEVVSNLAIIGAPNAGKSTLLNKLIGADRALVSDIPGTTVDPIEGFVEIFFGRDVDRLNKRYVSKQQLQEKEKQIDAEVESISGEREMEMIAAYEEFQEEAYDKLKDFHGDIDQKFAQDAQSLKMNEEDYLEKKIFEEDLSLDQDDETSEPEEIKKKERSTNYRSVKIVDTAGIRRQKSVKGFVESQSVFRALRAITDCDVVVMLMDATKGISHQDRRLCDIALEKGKSIIVCLNKVDLIREKIKDHRARKEWIQDLRDTIPWLDFCEIVTISAKYGQRIKHLRNAIKQTILVRNIQVTTSALNRAIAGLVARNQIFVKGSRSAFKIKYVSMVKSDPPTFLLFTNKIKDIPQNYRRYLKNGLRATFNLVNTPVHLIFRSNKKIEKKIF